MDSTVYDTMTPEYVDQLWAEALHYYNENPNQYLDLEQKLFGDFAEVQKGFKVYEDDPMIEYIRDILDKKYNINEDGEVTDVSQIDDYTTGKQNNITCSARAIFHKQCNECIYSGWPSGRSNMHLPRMWRKGIACKRQLGSV